jgi:hypothetical protein
LKQGAAARLAADDGQVLAIRGRERAQGERGGFVHEAEGVARGPDHDLDEGHVPQEAWGRCLTL